MESCSGGYSNQKNLLQPLAVFIRDHHELFLFISTLIAAGL